MTGVSQMELKKGFFSSGFYVGIFILTVAGIIGGWEFILYILKAEMPERQIRFLSAAYQLVCTDSFIFVMPIACTLAASSSYVEDVQNNLVYYVMLRTTRKDYCRSKVIWCGMFGIFITGISILLLLLISFILFPFNPDELNGTVLPGAMYYVTLLQKVIILLLNGSFFSLLGGTAASFSNNKYMAWSAPFIFYYVISTLADAYFSDLYLLNPREWILNQRSSPWAVICILLVLNVTMGVTYSGIIEGSWKNE